MNSNILSFDFDANIIDDVQDIHGFESFDAPIPEYKNSVELFVEDASDDNSYLSGSRSRNLSFLSTTSTSFSSRNSSLKTIDTSALEDDDEADQPTLFCGDGTWLEIEDAQPRKRAGSSPLPDQPFKKIRRESAETVTWCEPDCERRGSDASLFNFTIESAQASKPSAPTNYEFLMANARALIDSVSNTIQEISTNVDQRQQVWLERGYSPSSTHSPRVPSSTSGSPLLECFPQSPNSISCSSSADEVSSSSVVVEDTPQATQQTPSSDASFLEKHQQSSGYLSSLELVLVSPLEPVWYAERPFPTFTVQMTDKATRSRVDYVSGWRAAISMVDGFGRDATDKLSGSGQFPGHSFPFINGAAHVTGLRFRGVSSKCGGHFRLIVSVSQADSSHLILPPLLSTPIQVLSYRLFHAPKVSFEQLLPDDSLSKMKGIGSLYAKRFQVMGIERIAQLAAIDLNTIGESGLKGLLGNLRKDRGAMTIAKLAEYVQQARDICARAPHLQNANQTHTVARLTHKMQLARVNVQQQLPQQQQPLQNMQQQQQQQLHQQQQQIQMNAETRFSIRAALDEMGSHPSISVMQSQFSGISPLYTAGIDASVLFGNGAAVNAAIGTGPASFAAYLTSLQQSRGIEFNVDVNNNSTQSLSFE